MEKIRSVADLLKDSWGVFVKVWVKYLGLYLITVVGAVVILAVTLGSVFTKVIFEGSSQNPSPDILLKLWPMLLLGFVLLVIFSSIVGLAINKTVFSEAEGSPVKVGEALKYGFSNFASYLLVSLVTGLIVLIGIILLVIPGIYAAVVLGFVPMVFVLEGKRGMETLSRSRELAKGYFWPIFGRILILVLAGGALSALVNKMTLISLVVSFIIGLISIAYSYFIYKDLVAIKK